jgi:hypothetical protein
MAVPELSQRLEGRIRTLRGMKVMLSPDLAELYGVENRALVQAVKRNISRFPSDFMFQLDPLELKILKSQTVISRWGGSRRAAPYAFSEQGVAMLSSVLRSRKAIRVNIEIMRAFVRLREVLATHKELARRLESLERKSGAHDAQFEMVFAEIKRLMAAPDKGGKHIGFV